MPVGLYFCAVWQASQFWWNLVSCNRSSWTTFYLSFPFDVIHFVGDYILKFHGISKIALLLQYISVNILSESGKWMTKCKKKLFVCIINVISTKKFSWFSLPFAVIAFCFVLFCFSKCYCFSLFIQIYLSCKRNLNAFFNIWIL